MRNPSILVLLTLLLPSLSHAIPPSMVGTWTGGVGNADYVIQSDGSFEVRQRGSYFLVNRGVMDVVDDGAGLKGSVYYQDGEMCRVRVRMVGRTMVWSAMIDEDGVGGLTCSKTLSRSNYVPPMPAEDNHR